MALKGPPFVTHRYHVNRSSRLSPTLVLVLTIFAGGVRLGIAVVAALFLAAYPARAQGQDSSTNRPPVTFTDVSEQAGITFVHYNGAVGDKWYPEIFGGGVVVLDIDTDGWPDLLFVNGKDWDTGGERPPHGLYRNNQDGTFADVVSGSGFDTLDIYGLGATVADYDNDGRDDVFVTTVDGGRLFHNEGGGTFADVTREAGIANRRFAVSAAWLDYNQDGWPDLFVGNDRVPAKLHRNDGRGGFVDEGLRAGVALSEAGTIRGNMGADAADYDRSGRPDLIVGNFAYEMLGLYHNEDGVGFADRAPRSAVGRSSYLSTTWAVFFLDYDLDGYPDIFAANGANDASQGSRDRRTQIAQPPLLLWNRQNGTFDDVTSSLGESFNRPIMGRGRGVCRLRWRW